MPMRHLLTIGYEGACLEDFLKTLVRLRVDTVVDVRELPLSRKKGFSKIKLATALAQIGVGYRHERSLGCPREIRVKLRSTRDYVDYFAAFEKHLRTKADVVDSIVTQLHGRVALLCYERDANYCHRKSVAEQITRRFAIAPRHVSVVA